MFQVRAFPNLFQSDYGVNIDRRPHVLSTVLLIKIYYLAISGFFYIINPSYKYNSQSESRKKTFLF
jgi:hypothetical protein